MRPLQNTAFSIGKIQYKITSVWYGGGAVTSYEFETVKEPKEYYKARAAEFLERFNEKATNIKIEF